VADQLWVQGAGQAFVSGVGKAARPSYPRWHEVVERGGEAAPAHGDSLGATTKADIRERYREYKAGRQQESTPIAGNL